MTLLSFLSAFLGKGREVGEKTTAITAQAPASRQPVPGVYGPGQGVPVYGAGETIPTPANTSNPRGGACGDH
jgi:hypothetical protein